MRGFNEAGAVMPRKGGAFYALWVSRGSFNEAGAVMPRKGAIARAGPQVVGGFNEAGAVMPRKPGTRRKGHEQDEASMRPGLLCPGRTSIPIALQRSTRFNEAGAVMPRKVGVVTVTAVDGTAVLQ